MHLRFIWNFHYSCFQDNVPRFERMTYAFRVTEDHMPMNGVITTLRAFDNDTNENADLTYELMEQQHFVTPKYLDKEKYSEGLKSGKSVGCNASHWFAVHPNRGSVLIKRPLNYNTFHECSFSV